MSIHCDQADGFNVSHARRLKKLCGGRFTVADVLGMELRILATLQWRLHPTTPNCFVHQFLRLFPSDTSPQTLDKVGCVSQLLIEVAICQPIECSQCLPSELAYASLLLATEFVGPETDLSILNRQLWGFRMSTYCKLKSNCFNIRQAIRELGHLIREEEKITTKLCEILGEEVLAKQNHRFHPNEKTTVEESTCPRGHRSLSGPETS